MVFWYIVISFALVVAYAALAPKPEFNNQDAKPAGEDAFKFPTAEEGKDIPVLFGTRRCASPNVVWWGDLSNEPIIEEVETGGGGFLGF